MVLTLKSSGLPLAAIFVGSLMTSLVSPGLANAATPAVTATAAAAAKANSLRSMRGLRLIPWGGNIDSFFQVLPPGHFIVGGAATSTPRGPRAVALSIPLGI